MNRIIDISLEINQELIIWPEDPPVSIVQEMSLTKDDIANVSRMNIGVHTGTHIDAPKHFVDEGKTIKDISLDRLVGKVFVKEIADDVDIIDVENILDIDFENYDRILFKTRNSKLWEKNHDQFDTSYVGVSVEAAEYLVSRQVQLVGTDYLSVAPFHSQVPTHLAFLQNDVIILEGINLSQVEEGAYQLYCLPMKLGAVDGAPVRAILIS